jgi:hypothetical protein
MSEHFRTAIYNDCWMVRHYQARNDQKLAQAIDKLGRTVRYVFAQSEDFHDLLQALSDGLSDRDDTCVLRRPRRRRM